MLPTDYVLVPLAVFFDRYHRSLNSKSVIYSAGSIWR